MSAKLVAEIMVNEMGMCMVDLPPLYSIVVITIVKKFVYTTPKLASRGLVRKW